MKKSGNRFFRFLLWWQHLVPPILVLLYLSASLNQLSPLFILKKLPFFLLSIIGTAGFGYLLNDFTDIEEDKKAGKENTADKMAPNTVKGVLILLFFMGWAPWYFLPANLWNLGALGALFLCFILYSVRPFRLKEKGIAGPLMDTLYGHFLPAFITLATFLFPDTQISQYPQLIFSLLAWSFFKGLRNILQHQLDDRKKDKLAGTKTFVLKEGPLAVQNCLNSFVRPLEQLFLTSWLIFLALQQNWLILGYFAFFIWTWFQFSGWKMPTLPHRQLAVKFNFYLNDLYEDWLPILAVLLLIPKSPFWIGFAVLQIVLFPRIIRKFPQNFRTIQKNIREAWQES